MMMALKRNYTSFRYVSEALRDDKGLVRVVLKDHGDQLKHVSPPASRVSGLTGCVGIDISPGRLSENSARSGQSILGQPPGLPE